MAGKRKKRAKDQAAVERRELNSWYRDKKPIIIFGAKFCALMVLYYCILSASWGDTTLYFYLEANAWLSNAILQAFGQNTWVHDVVIQSPIFQMGVRRGCDAVEPTWLFCSAVLSLQGVRVIDKVLGIVVVTIAFQAINLVRLVSLFLIGTHMPSLFNTAHMEIWPTAFIAAAIVSFAMWKRWAANRDFGNAL
jgi:exosortase/archaeosortase family protein